MVSYYGRRQTTDTDAGLTTSGTVSNQRTSVFETFPEHGWVHTFYLLCGKPIGGPNASLRMAMMAVDSNNNPVSRMGYSATATVSTNMSNGADGTLYSAAVTAVDSGYGPTQNAIQAWAGTRYGLTFAATGGQLYHGMIAAANGGNNYSNNNLYRKNTSTVTPTDSPVYTTASYEGVMTIAVGYDPNDNPSTPTNRSPSGTITTNTPTFTSDFNDANSVRGDKIKEYQIQLRLVGTTALKWDDVFTASGAEQSSSSTTQIYAGSALSAPNSYEWRIRHKDQFNAWSSWSSWLTITLNAGGNVGQGSTPVGKQLTNQPGPFVAQWTHSGGLSTNAYQIQLRQGETVIQTSPIISGTVANNANISITWAASGFSNLAYGQTYQYRIRGRDTTGVWSDYGPNRTISINAYPNQPTLVSPVNGLQTTSLPKLTVKVTDPDDAAPLSSVTVRIKDGVSKAVLFTRTMSLRAGTTDTYDYQTIAADLATVNYPYLWDAIASDGTLTGQRSAERFFTYVTGPTVAITSPTVNQVLTTSTPTFTWTSSAQTTARLDIFLQGTTTPVVGANITGTGTSWAVPAGYLKNNTLYTFQVTSYNSGVSGTATQDFSLVYTAPAALTNFVVSPLAVAGDSVASALMGSWDQATDSPAVFQYYVYRRRLDGTAAGDSSEIILQRITSISQTTFVDTNPASDQSYIYSVSKVIQSGTDYIESLIVENTGMVSFDHVIISSATNGMTYRASLTYVTANRVDYKDDRQVFAPWGDTKPYYQIGSLNYAEVKGTYRAITDRRGRAKDIVTALRALKDRQITLADTLCYRDNRGRVLFGLMTLGEIDERLITYGVEITFSQSNYIEGVT